MNRFLLVLFVAVIGYKAFAFFDERIVRKPLYTHAHLVVYGRDDCGITQDTIKALTKARIKFEYLSLDDSSVAESLVARMDSQGLNIRPSYDIPVVELNGSFSFRPKNEDVITRAKSPSL